MTTYILYNGAAPYAMSPDKRMIRYMANGLIDKICVEKGITRKLCLTYSYFKIGVLDKLMMDGKVENDYFSLRIVECNADCYFF